MRTDTERGHMLPNLARKAMYGSGRLFSWPLRTAVALE
jgi:hypothetical protein